MRVFNIYVNRILDIKLKLCLSRLLIYFIVNKKYFLIVNAIILISEIIKKA